MKKPTKPPRAARKAPNPPRLRFKDTSWNTIVGLLALEMDGFDYSMYFRRTQAFEDTPNLLGIDLDLPSALSSVSRKYVGALYQVLDLVGRPKTIVRLRANLAHHSEAPDYIYRDLPRPTEHDRGDREALDEAVLDLRPRNRHRAGHRSKALRVSLKPPLGKLLQEEREDSSELPHVVGNWRSSSGLRVQGVAHHPNNAASTPYPIKKTRISTNPNQPRSSRR